MARIARRRLALPLTTSTDAPFPFRSEIILIRFMLILATLVLHDLSRTPLIPALDLEQDRTLEQKEAHARESAKGADRHEDTWCLAMARRFMLK